MNNSNVEVLKGSEIVIRCLERHDVDVVFAYPGGQTIELHQALTHSKKIRVVLPRHEQGGAFAANGYGRASGKVGVCMATSGPGATNLVSGIADAYMDSVPTIFITGQVPSKLIGKNAFQETDIIGVTRPIVKHSFLVLDAAELPAVFDQAFRLAGTGRPGPVVIDVPKNVQQQTCRIHWDTDGDDTPPEIPCASAEEIETIRKWIIESSRPCIYAGGGIITGNAAEELRQFVKAWNLPVATTLLGIGAIAPEDPHSLSWLGMHGTGAANYAANECDLLLTFGARFSDRVTGNPKNFARNARIVHVDIDDSEINKNRSVDLSVISDVKAALSALNQDPVAKDYTDWYRQIAAWKARYPRQYQENPERLQPQKVVETLSRMTGGEAVIVPGVGQHQMWAAQFYQYRYPRQLLTSGGFGAMGFGLPAAMGAKIACPEKTIINIDGDGSFQMNIQELGTLFVEEIDVKMIILNNQHLGMVSQWEDRFYDSNRANTVLGRCKGSCGKQDRDCAQCSGNRCTGAFYPDFVTIARGFGIPGRTVTAPEELEEALQEMLESRGAFLLDVHVGYGEHVLPMIPPGKDYRSMIFT